MMTTQRINLIFCLLVVTQLQYLSRGFQPIQSGFQAPLVSRGQSTRSHVIRFAVQQEEDLTTTTTTTPPINEEAARLRKEAELMRLQAEQMDMSLTLQKIEALESKLKNKSWLAKHPDQEVELQMQLQRLNDKLATATNAKRGTARMPNTLVEAPKPVASPAPVPITSETIALPRGEKPSPTNASLEPPHTPKQKRLPQTPLAGFDQEDLDLYIPIAEDINNMMPNGTIEEKLEAFRTAPELQSHFQKKIQNMLMGPLEEMQQLDKLRQEYLDSNSSKEREQLKREIEKLEKVLEEDGPFRYSEGIYCDGLEPLTDEELARRKEAVGALPDILIAIYKQRNSLGEDDDLELAIQMDYYEPQLQLLEQVRLLDPLEDDMRTDYIRGFNSLPKPVQQRYAQNNGVDKDSDAETVLKAALEESSFLSPLLQVVEASGIEAEEYNDIEFVDRSRFLEEFFPSIGNMEGSHPSMDDVERFSAEVLDKKCFMVSSKPERVAGGYYIRGTNLLNDDEDGTKTAADKLVAKVSEKLESSPLKDRLEFFYVLDPTPLTDEEIELGEREKPIFVVTTKDPQNFYRWAKPLTKFGVSLTGVLSTFMFSVGACALNPSIAERFYNTLDQSAESGVLDLTWFADLFIPTFAAFLGIQLSHELAHRAIALRDKFDVGLPTVVPSITTGLTGAITPIRSPPPNSKSMFDFALAGPVAGIVVSLVLLLNGLDLTASMALGTQLPVLPVDLLRASSLGGGLVEYFLGHTAILPDQGPAAVLPLHPYAIAGFMGLITNALALLPLGHTDGGRIAVAMFGRRGAFVVKLFTVLLLCVAGLFGLDDMNIFLVYALYVLVFQRELESPARNEVDELDFPRGLVGIAAALAVGLTLIPMI